MGGRGADEEFLGLVSSSDDVFTNLPRCQSTPWLTAQPAGLDWWEAQGRRGSFPLCLLNSSSRGVAKCLILTKSVALSSGSSRAESKDISSFSRVFQFSLTWTPFPESFWSPPPVFPPRGLSWISHWTQSANTGGTSKPTAQHRINTENRNKHRWEQDKPSNEGRQEKRGKQFRRNDGKELREKNEGRKGGGGITVNVWNTTELLTNHKHQMTTTPSSPFPGCWSGGFPQWWEWFWGEK